MTDSCFLIDFFKTKGLSNHSYHLLVPFIQNAGLRYFCIGFNFFNFFLSFNGCSCFLSSVLHSFLVLEGLIWDFGPYWNNSITGYQQNCQLHIQDANLIIFFSDKWWSGKISIWNAQTSLKFRPIPRLNFRRTSTFCNWEHYCDRRQSKYVM